jgi:hypothetical protein
VSELVQNSLDSGASHIDIGLDFADWSCWVRDDGAGIPIQGLDHIGSGGDNGRYGMCSAAHGSTDLPVYFDCSEQKTCTLVASGSSKIHTTHGLDNLTTFGFRGEGGRLKFYRESLNSEYSAFDDHSFGIGCGSSMFGNILKNEGPERVLVCNYQGIFPISVRTPLSPVPLKD